jgi:flagellar capping protein FliD
MGSDMRLTGLASGMDWQPIIDKLLELEAMPKQRLEREKTENDSKISDLGVLKSQLDTLKSSASALQNKSLFDSRTVSVDGSVNGFSASAGVGALTGTFSVLVESMATRTEVSSKNRTGSRLSAGLDVNDKLSELPLHSAITTGTFTIAGRTFNISSLDVTLQDILDEINNTVDGVSGVNPEGDSSGVLLNYDAVTDKMVFDSGSLADNSLNLTVLGSSTDTSNFLRALKLLDLNSTSTIQSTHPLGAIDMTVSLANANFANAFSGLTSGMGNFFIGEGEGAVRIDYNINEDSVADLIERINSSEGDIYMFYDPVGDRFVARNKETGSQGIILHESSSWDSLSSANKAAGNILELMGLAPPPEITNVYDVAELPNYKKGDWVKLDSGSDVTYWQTLTDAPSSPPSPDSTEWFQVIPSVLRTLPQELGQNASVRVNGGEEIYSSTTSFSSQEHGYSGISFDIGRVSIGREISFSVDRDASQAKSAIEKFVTEFNDAQDYIASLTSVSRDGDDVQSSRFTGNQELNRLGSQLRRLVFGNSSPHSESGTTIDNSNLTISSNNAANDDINAIASQIGLGSEDSGYIIKVLDQDSTGQNAFFEWDGTTWESVDASFSVYRLTNVGMDFGIGSNKINIKDSALLTKELEDNPDLVYSLFSEETIEDAFDTITQTNRNYEGITYSLNDYITNFLSGDSDTGYQGAYQAFVDRLKKQNERIDEKIISFDKYLESRERILSQGFMRMEEMQSKMDTQMQTLQNSFNNKK